MLTGLVSNIQKYSLQDGPGIRTTVFFKGCPLRCAWCHNPENISRQPQLLLYPARCVQCGACADVCPQWVDSGLARLGPSSGPFSPGQNCVRCGACAEVCPTGARVMVGRSMSLEALLDEILADRIFYDDSGGGVTFSGGEPLSQFEFLKAALQACKSRGVQTAVDTCGSAPQEHLLAIAHLVDLFLYDVKLIDEARHREYCNASNRVILANLRALTRVHSSIWIRIPIIPGINDGTGEIEAMARLVQELPGIRQVSLLPYHKIGLPKFERLGQAYALADVAPPSRQAMETLAAQFNRPGLDVQIGA